MTLEELDQLQNMVDRFYAEHPDDNYVEAVKTFSKRVTIERARLARPKTVFAKR